MASVVKIKLFLWTDLLWFDNTNYAMQNTIQKFRQRSIVFDKPSILSENLRTLTSSNYPTVQYFLPKLRTRFLLTNIYKMVSGIFFILSQSWVICKNLKRPGFFKKTHSLFCTFINNSRSTQNKKNPAHDFVDITK